MIDLSHLSGKTIGVLGLGKTGLTAALALNAGGAHVLAWDDDQSQRDAADKAGVALTDLNTVDLSSLSFLLLSPGIPHTYPKPHPLVARVKQAGIKIVSDIELLIAADPAAKIIAVTGTNGKSTTTALIAHILGACGVRLAVGGNLGQPVLGFNAVGEGGAYVLELSSYQLELTPSLAPDIGVLLNITPDHLGRHGGMEGYVAAKRSLFRRGTRGQTAIIGIDDEPCREIAFDLANAPAFTEVTIATVSNEASITAAGGLLADHRSGFAADLRLIASLPGAHNWQNAAAAYAACLAYGIDPQRIFAALKTFPGLAHRQQRIATIDGISYINDSKATNAEAAAKALVCYEPIYWIAGGQPKEGGLDGLENLMPRVRRAFLIGEAEAAFAQWCDRKTSYSRCGTLDRALHEAHNLAQQERLPHAVVLLSPACASWDQFKSFEQRGDIFTEAVRALANKAHIKVEAV